MRKRTAGILKWTGVAVVALAVLYVILLVASTIFLKRARAALESDGRPVKSEEIIPPEIPDADNAALVYEAAVLQLKSEPAGEQDLFSRLGEVAGKMLEETPGAETIEEFRQLSEKKIVGDALAAIETGSRKPGYWNDLDYSLGPAIEFPNLNDLRSLSRLLCATARLQTIDGDDAEALASAITALRVANALEDEPLLISQLVRMANLGLALEAVHGFNFSASPSGPQLEEIETLLRSFEDPARFAAAIDGERLLFGEWAFDLSWAELRSLQDEGRGAEAVVTFEYLFPPLKRRDFAAYLTVMHALAKNMMEPYSADDAALDRELLGEVPRYCVLTRMATPAVSQIKARLISMTARSRVTRGGLAVLQHRHESGQWPADLQSIGKDGLADPFTGKPLVYRQDPDGFILYSVGENLADDQGTNDEEDKDDIAWRYSGKGSAQIDGGNE